MGKDKPDPIRTIRPATGALPREAHPHLLSHDVTHRRPEWHLVQAVADKLGETVLLRPERSWRLERLAKRLTSGYASDIRTFVASAQAASERDPSGGPSPTDQRVVIGDIHGNPSALLALLRAADVINDKGERNPRFWVCQLGDLIHGGDDVTFADADTLTLAERSIDTQLVGNHEAPFLVPDAPPFEGIHADPAAGQPRHPSCQEQLDTASGRWQAAVAVDGWLITHAGLSPAFLHGPHADPELVAACDPQASPDVASALAEVINRRFRERVARGERDALFDAIGPARGGPDPVGGMLWCDWHALKREVRRLGSPCPQIVGHTSMPMINRKVGNHPRRVKRAGRTMLINADLAGIDQGYVACLIKAAGQPEWTAITIDRPPRPALPLDGFQGRS